MKFCRTIATCLMLMCSAGFAANSSAEKTVGIVLPMDHVALRAIVSGFEKTIQDNYPGKVNFVVQNAQHDMNMQRAIIQKFINQKVDLIVPVATSTTQMAISMVKDQPVLGLAAMIPESVRQQNNLSQHFTAVRDEIDSAKQVDFIQGVLPNIKKITLIYSSDDKVVPEAKETIAQAKKYGITVQPLMIQNLSELYTTSQHIDKDSQAIFVLKDNLIASGINTIVYNTKSRHIPIITSDEGTVSGGSAAALGVEEKQIGKQGGELAVRILKGESLTQLATQDMKELVVFVNTKAAIDQGLPLVAIQKYAKDHHYVIRENPVINS